MNLCQLRTRVGSRPQCSLLKVDFGCSPRVVFTNPRMMRMRVIWALIMIGRCNCLPRAKTGLNRIAHIYDPCPD